MKFPSPVSDLEIEEQRSISSSSSHRPIMNIRLLCVDGRTENPRFNIDIRGFHSGDEVLVVQLDVRGVPNGQV